MEEAIDPFDFLLAERLGMTVATLRSTMPNNEYLQWRAFTAWRAAQAELAGKP